MDSDANASVPGASARARLNFSVVEGSPQRVDPSGRHGSGTVEALHTVRMRAQGEPLTGKRTELALAKCEPNTLLGIAPQVRRGASAFVQQLCTSLARC